jgi:hypothetical protein
LWLQFKLHEIALGECAAGAYRVRVVRVLHPAIERVRRRIPSRARRVDATLQVRNRFHWTTPFPVRNPPQRGLTKFPGDLNENAAGGFDSTCGVEVCLWVSSSAHQLLQGNRAPRTMRSRTEHRLPIGVGHKKYGRGRRRRHLRVLSAFNVATAFHDDLD